MAVLVDDHLSDENTSLKLSLIKESSVTMQRLLAAAIFILGPTLGLSQQDVFYVDVRGYGESLNEARITAARAALSESVGTFIDASISLEEKIQIENDYVQESSVIEKNIFEYSQGVIRSIDVVSSVETDGVYEIEARVGISKQETMTFVTEKLSKLRKVKAGLFASIVTNRDNRLGQFGIFEESVWSPLDNNQGVEVGISGEIVEAALEEYSSDKKSNQGNTVLKIPITYKLSDSYLSRAINSLENIAEYSEYSDGLFYNGLLAKFSESERAPIFRVIIGDLNYTKTSRIQFQAREEFGNNWKELRLPSAMHRFNTRYRANTKTQIYTVESEAAVRTCGLIPRYNDIRGRYIGYDKEKYTPHGRSFSRNIPIKIELIGNADVLKSEIYSVQGLLGVSDFSGSGPNGNLLSACRFYIDTTRSVPLFIEVDDTILSETVEVRATVYMP